jgi:dihydrofolate reductase
VFKEYFLDKLDKIRENKTMMKTYLISALSLDGFIAKDLVSPSTAWTSKEDKKMFQMITKELKVVIMGGKTYRTFNRPLKERINIIYTRDKEKLKSFDIDKINVQDETTLYYTDLKPNDLLSFLEEKGFQNVAICGGQNIYSWFAGEGLVNYLYLTIENVIFGQGLKLFNCNLNLKTKLISKENLNESTLLLKYKVLKEG